MLEPTNYETDYSPDWPLSLSNAESPVPLALVIMAI